MTAYCCHDCGLTYVKEVLEERRKHRRYHDEAVNGISANPLKSEKVIWTEGDSRIVVVTPISPKPERVRARKVGQLANRDVHHDCGIYDEDEPPDFRDLHLFLYCVNNRTVGLAIFEKRGDHVCRYTWEEYDRYEAKEMPSAPPIWSFSFAWVLRKNRRRGIASTLFEKSIHFLKVPTENVGLYTPFSPEGESLLRALFPTEFLIAK